MRKLLIVGVFLGAFLSSACDPTIEYNPKDWSRIRNYEFTNKYDGFDLELRGFHGLIGSRNYILEGEILNTENIAQKIYIQDAVLRANGQDFVGEPNDRNENIIVVAKPNTRQHFSIYWQFNKSLSDVLEDPVELLLTVKRADQVHRISILMTEKKN